MDLTQVPETLSPAIWGKKAWEFIEMLIISYPLSNPSLEKRDAVMIFFENLGDLLPCRECSSHYKLFIQRESIQDALQGRNALFEFYYRLRLDVASRSGERISSREDLWKAILMRFHLYPVAVQTRPRQPAATNQLMKNLQTRRRGCNCGR